VISSASIADRDRASPRYSSVLSVEAWDRDEVAAAGMGALAAVARGSHEEPPPIVLRYEPLDAVGPLVAFVDKGVTLDTDGLWLKPKESLAAERHDMSGGAAVLAAIGAIAEVGLRSGSVGEVGTTENDRRRGHAAGRRPARARRHDDRDDQQRHRGPTRARRLPRLARHEGAERLVAVATLTCGAITALGFNYPALFANSEDWAAKLQAAAELSGERVWRQTDRRPRRSARRATLACQKIRRVGRRRLSSRATALSPRRHHGGGEVRAFRAKQVGDRQCHDARARMKAGLRVRAPVIGTPPPSRFQAPAPSRAAPPHRPAAAVRGCRTPRRIDDLVSRAARARTRSR
jgi:hypothetical protein